MNSDYIMPPLSRYIDYQFDDAELLQIDRQVKEKSREEAYLTFHCARMYKDAARLKVYEKSGIFPM
jgi:uncharacterized protein YecE (DUF72 family)